MAGILGRINPELLAPSLRFEYLWMRGSGQRAGSACVPVDSIRSDYRRSFYNAKPQF
jgi:hypothetical protein